MRRRLYFILPDRASAEAIERDLLLARIDDHHFHFMAREGVELGTLNRANLLQRSDIVHGSELGLMAGGLTGALAGLGLYLFPRLAEVIGMGVVLVLAVLGALIGAWAAGMVGVSIPNSRLKGFERALEAGHILLMVDVPPARIDEIRELILAHHPEAAPGGQETRLPAFP